MLKDESVRRWDWVPVGIFVLFSASLLGCGGSDNASTSSCTALTGSAWVPSVAGVAATNHDSSVTLSQTVIETSGPLLGLTQAAPSSSEISVTFDMPTDLGATGSITLMGQVTQFPSTLQGGAFAYLVSLSDGVNEFINLARAGSGSDCAAKGYYSCTSGVCDFNKSCTISWPSAFYDLTHWAQHQNTSSSGVNSVSVNTFPTCNWSGGSNLSSSDPSCAFNTHFFQNGKLRTGTGVQYTAKYVLLSDSYSTLSSKTAGLKVTVVKKTSQSTTPGGAIDINFILVGSKNVQASRAAKGQQNLNTLASAVASYYAQSNSNVKIGTVRSIEWPCDTGGDQYANVGISKLGNLFASSSTVLPAGLDTQALNVFFVSTIYDDTSGSNSNLTILGIDGAIGGPVLNGTAVSGMAVSTFNLLDQYNPSCSSSGICSASQYDADFFQLTDTVSHEMGHYFGLNHLSESDGKTHDFLKDTPICTATESVRGLSYLTIKSCLNNDTNVFPAGSTTTCLSVCSNYSASSGSYCPLVEACQFNNIMWWTAKNFTKATGTSDGMLFSTNQGAVIHFHPLVQ